MNRRHPIAFENCGLCGDTLEGALDIGTGVCQPCVDAGGW